MSRKREHTDTGNEDGQHEGDSAAAVGLVELVRMLREEQAEQQCFMLDAMQRMMECSGRDDEHRERRRHGDAVDQIRLARLTEADDIESYITTFERMMRMGDIAEETWTLRLAPQLTGKAQQAYAAISAEDAAVNHNVKEAILRRYDISPETYRQRFRNTRRSDRETYTELAVRLQDLVRKWMADCSTIHAVLEKLVTEQLMNTMPLELRIWISERKPTTGGEAGWLADDYVQARRHVRGTTTETKKEMERIRGREGRKRHVCGEEGHLMRACPKRAMVELKPQLSGGAGPNKGGGLKKPVKCYNCGEPGHISTKCPERASYYCMDSKGHSAAREGFVDGTTVTDILLDTGCTRTMVREELVAENKLLPGEAVTVLCAHGDTVLYPLANVTIEVEGIKFPITAAVSMGLPVSVLLGTDVPQLGELLHSNPLTVHTESMDHALVSTRAQRKQQQKEEKEQRESEQQCAVQAKPLSQNPSNRVEPCTMGEEGSSEVQGAGGKESDQECIRERGEGSDRGMEESGNGGVWLGEEDEDGGCSSGEVMVGSGFADELMEGPVERIRLSRKQKRERGKESIWTGESQG